VILVRHIDRGLIVRGNGEITRLLLQNSVYQGFIWEVSSCGSWAICNDSNETTRARHWWYF
jgi:hypothetical protein